MKENNGKVVLKIKSFAPADNHCVFFIPDIVRVWKYKDGNGRYMIKFSFKNIDDDPTFTIYVAQENIMTVYTNILKAIHRARMQKDKDEYLLLYRTDAYLLSDVEII